jgi:enamine deaminase RidA (YjgF/YER057c/UK114 family)
MMDIYEKIKELGLILPEPPPKGGIYKPVKQVGNMLYISGQGATIKGVPAIKGKVGAERTIEEGQEAARICALNALSVLHAYLGDLNKIKSLIKILAFVESAPGFNQQPKVVDGASRLFEEIFGSDRGVGARSAIGTNELPGDITVEIEFIFEI